MDCNCGQVNSDGKCHCGEDCAKKNTDCHKNEPPKPPRAADSPKDSHDSKKGGECCPDGAKKIASQNCCPSKDAPKPTEDKKPTDDKKPSTDAPKASDDKKHCDDKKPSTDAPKASDDKKHCDDKKPTTEAPKASDAPKTSDKDKPKPDVCTDKTPKDFKYVTKSGSTANVSNVKCNGDTVTFDAKFDDQKTTAEKNNNNNKVEDKK